MIGFRTMTEADLPRVLENELRAYAYPWTRGNFLDCLRAGNICQVAGLVDDIIGHGVLSVGAGEAHLLNVCIGRDHQGLGFGRQLVAHMLEQARSRAAEMVFLEVRPSNHAAVMLYESLGFNAIAVRRNYYPSPFGHEDASVMALDMRGGFSSGEAGGV